jgi:preprotein translocase subunit YajC
MEEFILVAFVLILGMGAYWSMVIFPKQRDFSKRQRLVRTLAEGDEVITAGGIVGRVIEVRGEEGIAFVEIAPGLKIKVISASILDAFDPEELAENVRKAMGDREESAQA